MYSVDAGEQQHLALWTLMFSLAFILVTVIVVRHSAGVLDRSTARVADWTGYGPLAAITRPVVEDIGWVGAPFASLHLVAVVAVLLLLSGCPWRGGLLLGAFVAVVAAEMIIGVWVSGAGWHALAWVPVTQRADTATGSFPSGHAARAVLALVATAWLLPRRYRPVGITVAGVVSGLAALSRVQTGKHSGSDAVGGLLLGAAVVCVWLALLPRVARLEGGKRPAEAGTDRCPRPTSRGGARPRRGTRSAVGGPGRSAATMAGLLAGATVVSLVLSSSWGLLQALDHPLAQVTRWMVAGPLGQVLRPVVQPSDELGVVSFDLCLTAVLVCVLLMQERRVAAGLLVAAVIGLTVVLTIIRYPSAEAARVTMLTSVEAALLPRRWRPAGIAVALTLSGLAVLSRVDSGIPGGRAALGLFVGVAVAGGWVVLTQASEFRPCSSPSPCDSCPA